MTKESIVIDRKFKILAVNPCNGKVYTHENAMLFCAHDAALISTLNFYKKECVALSCDEHHIKSVELLIERIVYYQEKVNLKIPDTNTECEIKRCIEGKE